MADEFVNFDNALNELGMTADQLKRLVSEGEIRAVRGENDTMRFRRDEIDRLKKQSGPGGLDESSDTLTDDLLFDEADDLEVDDGMATAQISSEDTFIGDEPAKPTLKPTVKPSAKPTVKPAVKPTVAPKAGKPAKAAPPAKRGAPARPSPAVATPVPTSVRRTTGRSTRMRQQEQAAAGGVGAAMTVVMGITAAIALFASLFLLDISKDQASSATEGFANQMLESFAATARPAK